MVSSEDYAINHDLVDVISQSFAASVPTFPSAQSIFKLRSAFRNAARHQVSVLAGTGDWGPTGFTLNLSSYFARRITQWPASDPLVTAVGGTQLHLSAQGLRTAPDNVWNDTFTGSVPSPAAAGSGLSDLFPRPAYEQRLSAIIGNHRAYPDVSMSAAASGGVLIYLSAAGPPPGWYHIGGTSESSPLFAGVVAIADQAAGHRLGLLNPRLYALGTGSGGLVDITRGGNTVSFERGGSKHTVPGWHARAGYDIVSGLGTVDAWRLVTALARQESGRGAARCRLRVVRGFVPMCAGLPRLPMPSRETNMVTMGSRAPVRGSAPWWTSFPRQVSRLARLPRLGVLGWVGLAVGIGFLIFALGGLIGSAFSCNEANDVSSIPIQCGPSAMSVWLHIAFAVIGIGMLLASLRLLRKRSA